MFGLKIKAALDRGNGEPSINLELSPPRDEKSAVEKFTSFMNDPRVVALLGKHHGMAISTEEQWLRKAGEDRDMLLWAIYADDNLIGSVGIFSIDRENRKAELGIMIGDRDWWGKGIATAVEMMVVEYAFNNIAAGGLNKVYAVAFTENSASISALRKVGFRETGIARQDAWNQGRWLDNWRCELLREEWQSIREDRFKAAGLVSLNLYPGCEDLGLDPVL